MSRTIKSVLFAVLLCTGFISCEKEYSIESGSGTGPVSNGSAVFTFAGAPNACAAPVINGNYKVGTAMAASNTIVLSVNVTVAGTYTISTGQVNGVTFSVTSSFSTTGPQIVQLLGSGTPTSAGPFNYTPGTSGCAFSITFDSNGGVSIGTANYTCTDLVATGTYTQNSTLGSSNTLVLKVNVTTAGTYSITNGPNDGFTFSGSGTLAVGAQTITLAGSGIPAQPGTATFSFGSGTTVCSVDINVIAASGGGGNTTDYLKATIAGTATNTFNANLTGLFTAYSLPATPGTLNVSGGNGPEILELGFISATGNVTAITYKNLTPSNVLSGVIIQYTDTAGNSWLSSTSVANTCTAIITGLTPTRATGTFSGTLYNSSETITKTVTNGSFSVPL
jgi:hypothetical protein